MGMITTFTPGVDICTRHRCKEMLFTDATTFITYNYKDINKIYLTVTQTGTDYTTGELDITTSMLTADILGNITSNGSTTLSGLVTDFSNYFIAGDYIYIADTNERIRIESLQSDTQLTLYFPALETINSTAKKANMTKIITPADLVLTDTYFPEGRYAVEYKIKIDKGGGVYETFRHYQEIYIYCTITCCKNTMLYNAANLYSCYNIDNDIIRQALDYNILYKSFLMNLDKCNWAEAQTIYNVLETICEQENCQC